jgi:hypothetical protein
VHAGDHGGAIIEFDVLAPLADVGGVDLEVQPDQQLVSGGEPV